jgi:signal transduction histidine kinase
MALSIDAPPLDAAILPAPADDAVQILLVDDEPANLKALELSLASTGCRFVHARSADEALLALLDQDFAAIVLDVRMPGMTGLELANMIKGRRRTRHVPILFLTAHLPEEREILKGYGVGAVDYLTKPISPDILRSKIAVFVDLFRATRALSQTNEALQREAAERQRMAEALRQANEDLEARVAERTAALREADRRKDEFLASLAHELRNPMAALRSAAEVYRMRAPAGVELEAPQGVIDRQLRQMTRLLDDLLDVSRITRGQFGLQRGRVELSRVIQAAVETSRPALEQRGHILSVSLPVEPVYLDADQARLSQVFANLLDNAAKYTEPGGRIRVTAEVTHGAVFVRVADSGIGIARDALPHVFDLFYQSEGRTTTWTPGGLEIGLTLVRRIVDLHGGHVTSHSDGPGRGSEFVVRLPTLGDMRQPQPERESADPVEPLHPLRVLIVEDNRDAAAMLDVLLKEWGQETRVTHDALIALEVAGQFKPHIVLLDIGLPQLHGYEVARRIRQDAWGKRALLVAITGWGQEADRQQSKAAGIDFHLVKPVDPAALRTLLAGYQPRS